jgi:nitrate/nitrite transporter NarK
VVPESISIQKSEKKLIPLTGIKELFNKPAIWLQAVIVICAYVGYKTTDDFSLYASDAFNYHDVAAAKIGTVSFWVRPFAAVGAGFLADKFSASKMSLISFGLVVIGSAAIAFGILRPNMYLALILVIVTTSMGIYALRGIYFALFQESNIHLAITGSAVGLVSFIGFTPDIFMGPLMGFLIDRSPGALGHQHVFLVLSLFSLVGLTAVFLFRKSVSGNN